MNAALRSWNLIIGLSLVAMIGLTIYDRITPMPSFSVSGDAKAKRIGDIRSDRFALESKNDELEASIKKMLWVDTPEAIGPKALGIVNLSARNRLVKVMAFRPQKPLEEGKFEILPYQISVEGKYEAVITLVSDLEASENRLVVQSVQFTSADGESSNVKASIGIWALRDPKAKPVVTEPVTEQQPEPKVSAEDVSKETNEKN